MTSAAKAFSQSAVDRQMTAQSMKTSTRKHSGSGIVQETPQGRSTIGRRAGTGSLDGEDGFVIGVDIGGSNLRVALAALSGTVLGKWSTSTKETSSPEMVITQIGEGIDSLLNESSTIARLAS